MDFVFIFINGKDIEVIFIDENGFIRKLVIGV